MPNNFANHTRGSRLDSLYNRTAGAGLQKTLHDDHVVVSPIVAHHFVAQPPNISKPQNLIELNRSLVLHKDLQLDLAKTPLFCLLDNGFDQHSTDPTSPTTRAHGHSNGRHVGHTTTRKLPLKFDGANELSVHHNKREQMTGIVHNLLEYLALNFLVLSTLIGKPHQTVRLNGNLTNMLHERERIGSDRVTNDERLPPLVGAFDVHSSIVFDLNPNLSTAYNLDNMSARNDTVVTIYTRPLCGYCLAAKRILQHEGVAFVEVDCSDDPAACERIQLETGHHTVPMIFLGDNFIGGYDDLRRLVQKGTLAKYPRTTKE